MKLPRLRTILLVPVILFALFYLTGAVMLALDDRTVATLDEAPADYRTVAIFGASGTAGDGILKAALTDPGIGTIHVITRRATPRIEEGVAAGKVQMTLHTDYLDYSALRDTLAAVDAVYWAIGLSSIGVDEATYGMIHVDFPMRFVAEWLGASEKPDISFHYISSSDISEDSSAMWARQKVRTENSLFGFADGTRMLSNVVASQSDLHAEFGGVVPEIASRVHTEVITEIIDRALSGAGCVLGDVDAVAVTTRPASSVRCSSAYRRPRRSASRSACPSPRSTISRRTYTQPFFQGSGSSTPSLRWSYPAGTRASTARTDPSR